MALNHAMDNDSVLSEMMVSFYDDPLGYVMFCFPWDTQISIQRVKLAEKYKKRFNSEYGPDVWACEFLDDLGEQIKARKFDGRNAVEPIKYATASGHGIGKDQPYSLVLGTPDGVKKWENVRVGDRLFGASGKPVQVIARHEQGIRPMYRVKFSDGTSTLCGLDHVWRVRGRQERRVRSPHWRDMTTRQLLEAGVKRSNGIANSRQWEIPSCLPVEYEHKDLVVDPYVAGVWLGDGTKHTGGITSADPEIWEFIETAGFTLSRGWQKGQTRMRTAYGLKVKLKEAGLLGCTTLTAGVPEDYMYASSSQRLSVLQGLLDTDGWVEKSGTVAFGSISAQLAKDVAWLARSLGMVARTKPAQQKWYKNGFGGKKEGKPFFLTTITWDGESTLFRLGRKQGLLTVPEARYRTRWIDNIEYSHDEQSMCVTVDASDGLYLTNDFIVTHNSTLVAWLCKFIMDTRPYSKGTVTANTAEQLKTKTWAEVGKWHSLSLTQHWCKYSATRGSMSLVNTNSTSKEPWRLDAQTCREENSESFAGQHAPAGSSFYIFDEASGIPDKIFEVREGGLTDGEPMVFDFGNPTRNSGRFFENAAGKFRHRYLTRTIDSRDVALTNKELMKQWVEDYGEDSDFVKVRVRGMFPSAGSLQFIKTADVEAAMRRETFYDRAAPLIIGVDVARFGDDESVIFPRLGMDARSFPPLRFQGLDTVQLTGKVIECVREFRAKGLECAGLFVDGGGIGGGVVDQLRNLAYNPIEVQFGGGATDKQTYRFKSDEMWGNMRDAIANRLILPDNLEGLKDQLTQREYGYTLTGNKIHLETKKDMKARGVSSPDLADALALTFAMEVAPKAVEGQDKQTVLSDYDPFAMKF